LRAIVTAQEIKGQSSQSTTIPADATAFEVASIKPIRPPLPTGGRPWIASRGRFRAEAAQVRAVTIGKNGPKLQDARDGRKSYIDWTGPGQVTFTEATLVGLTAILASFLGAPVLDETGLRGTYNYSLEFADARLSASREPRLSQGDSRPDLFTAVQEQLGLHLQGAKRPIEFVAVGHVKRPSGELIAASR
jgi:hypothetical protein